MHVKRETAANSPGRCGRLSMKDHEQNHADKSTQIPIGPDGRDPAQTTTHMLNELKQEKDIEGFIRRNEQAFYNKTIADYMETLLEKSGISKGDAIKRADIERGYGYQILRGVRGASRDKYIRIALGIGLNLEETQHMLMVARQGALYPKVMRDAMVIFCINNRFDVHKAQALLFEHHLNILE
jgi:hypothetical protein